VHRRMVLLFVFGLAVSVWAADPFAGMWKLNLAKSKFGSGEPPKGIAFKVEAQENGLKIVTDGVNSQGQPMHQELSPKYDGREYPLKSSDGESGITVIFKRINAHTHEVVIKQGGTQVQIMREVVSSDGKTWTRTVNGSDNIMVFDKQ